MKKKYPLISILINCYNSEKYLKECLTSAISQTYENFEIIIWDNCSTDKTAKICKEFKDNRIKYHLSNSHKNLVNARISAWKKISGDYVAIMDSDDLSLKDRLNIQLGIIKQNKNIAVVGGSVQFINSSGKNLSIKQFPTSKNLIMKKIYYQFPMNNSTLFFDKKKIDEVGGYSIKYEFINDFELVYRLSKKYDLVNTNLILSKNRVHKENLSNKKFLPMQYELYNFLNKIKFDTKSYNQKFLNFTERFKCAIRIFNRRFFNV